jgi:hypothetical protein
MKKIFYTSIFTSFILLSSFSFVSAMESLVPCGPGTGEMCTLCHFVLLAKNIFDFILKISFAAAILFVAIAGILYITSAGSESLMKTAKQAMTYALVGFGLCLAAWLLIQIVASALGYTETWWKIDMDCADFGETQRKIDCDQSGGTWNPETNECKCDPGEELFKNKCVPSNLVAKIKECEAGQNQEWDYNENQCNCRMGYFRNLKGNCVDILCWDCSYEGIADIQCGPPCKKIKPPGILAKVRCIPGDSCGGEEAINIGALGTPCGERLGSRCVATDECKFGEDNVRLSTHCKEGKCCKAQPPIQLSECNLCEGYDPKVNASSYAADKYCKLRADGSRRWECIISEGKCIPNPDVCK